MSYPFIESKIFFHKHLIIWTRNHLNPIKKKEKIQGEMTPVLAEVGKNIKNVA
jgi:hypothetical protein